MKTVIEAPLRSRVIRVATLALCLLLLGLGCEGAGSETVGGETHFLRVCDSSMAADQCGDGFSCLCNVCTLACDAQSACAAQPGASCVNAPATCAARARAFAT